MERSATRKDAILSDMRFVIKIIFYAGIVTGGSVLVIDRIPWLKANILEIVNPRIQEGELVRTLQQNLEQLDAVLPKDGAATSAAIRKSQRIIAESRDLLEQIADINDRHDDVMDGVVAKVVDALIDPIFSSVAPTPAATPVPSPIVGSPIPSSAVSPCVPQ